MALPSAGTSRRLAPVPSVTRRWSWRPRPPPGRGQHYRPTRPNDTRDFVATVRALGVTPHVAQHTTKRRSAIDARTTRHPGYGLSQRARKRVEEIFGWLKSVALLRQTRHRGRAQVGWMFVFGLAAYNLIRIRNLTWPPV